MGFVTNFVEPKSLVYWTIFKNDGRGAKTKFNDFSSKIINESLYLHIVFEGDVYSLQS